MIKVLLTLTVIVAGLSVTALDINAQNSSAQSRRQQEMQKWHQEMEEFKARSEQRREINELTDSIAGVQAAVAVQNRDCVNEAELNIEFSGKARMFTIDGIKRVESNKITLSPGNIAIFIL